MEKIIRIKMYLHSNKESNWDKAEKLGFSEKATSNFRYALSEVVLDVDVDTETGLATIAKVDGVPLEPTELLYDFYKHLEQCPGVDVNGIWEAMESYGKKQTIQQQLVKWEK